MQKNDLIRIHEKIYRILDVSDNEILIIDCVKLTMPEWIDEEIIADHDAITDKELCSITDICLPDVENLAPEEKRVVHKRFSIISSIIPCVADTDKRSDEIRRASELNIISRQH